jgi:mono/diheme cytochrome c family protein
VLPPFPAASELEPPAERRSEVLRGRELTAQFACSGCHGGAITPAAEPCAPSGCREPGASADSARPPVWLAGMVNADQEFPIGPFRTRPRNLTPHNTTGMGRFTERQIFNALRYGLRPGETPDVEITSTTPGVGNFPLQPKYLAPPMPWPAWRHIADDDLRAIAAYLKHGVKPMANRVADSDGPPDFWASEYTVEKYGPYPAPPFPTAREQPTQTTKAR